MYNTFFELQTHTFNIIVNIMELNAGKPSIYFSQSNGYLQYYCTCA